MRYKYRKCAVIIGNTYPSKNYGEFKVLSRSEDLSYSIEFLDTGTVVSASRSNIISGAVKDPTSKTVYGVGYYGVGAYDTTSSDTHEKCYNIWRKMLHRCYTEPKSKFNSYEDCFVCEEWHNFQNFAEWFHKQPYILNKDATIDKDIICSGNKEYCASKCAIVPAKVNTIFTHVKVTNKGLPIGVRKTKEGNYSCEISKENTREYLGTFGTASEASKAYVTAKEKYSKQIGEKYIGVLSDNVCAAMINWTMEPKYE